MELFFLIKTLSNLDGIVKYCVIIFKDSPLVFFEIAQYENINNLEI